MTDDLAAALADADETYRERQAAVEEYGEDALQTVADAYRDLTAVLDRSEDSATGTGDFEEFLEFQGRVATLVEDLPEDVPKREAFEAVSEVLHARHLRGKHFSQARDHLADVEPLVERLERRDEALETYREARLAVIDRREELQSRVDHLESLVAYEDVDWNAPVTDLRDPIEAYNDAVADAVTDFEESAPARDFLDWLGTVARDYPLVDVEAPPGDVVAFLADAAVGAEPLPTVREYAGYSRSKLDHYVADPGRFLAVVGGSETYLAGLSADPFTVDWPPRPADELRFRCDELVAAVGRLDDDAAARCRDVRALTRRDDYERLREAAVARDVLDADERERVASGAARESLAEAEAELARLDDALDAHPER
ncbi:MAG: hypothetical protein ABEJ68_02700 [Halobacteriaceae archaeon]